MSGPGALACQRAQPFDGRFVIPADDFVRMKRQFLGIEPYVASTCPCCGIQDADARHARICPRAGAQVNQHQPFIHALSRELRRHRIRHVVEDGSPFTRDLNLRRDITVVAGELRNASNGTYIHKGLLVDGTFADPQAAVHLRQGSATVDALLPQPPRRIRTRSTLGRDMCPSTSVATNFAPSRRNVLGASEE